MRRPRVEPDVERVAIFHIVFGVVTKQLPWVEVLPRFDAAFFDLAEQVARALDNVEQTLADESGLPAAIRNLTSLARLAVETYEKRSEVVTGTN